MMTLFLGKDRKGQTHYVRDDARIKACGYHVAICGTEVLPTEEKASGAPVQCFYCNHAYDLGVHLIESAQKPA